MLPNKINFFNYKPISAPENLDAYKSAIDNAVSQYDKNVEAAGVLEIALSKIKALPSDVEYVNAVKQKLQDSFSNLATTVQGNKRWDLANDTLNEMKLTILKDQNLQGIQDSYKGYQDELDLEQKLMASGKTPVNLNIVDWKNHRTISPNGELNIYRSKVQPKADYNAEMFEIAKVLQPEVIDSALQASGTEGFLMSVKKEQLTDEMINNKMPEMFRTYVNTDSYKQEKVLKLKELNQRGITGQEAEKQADLEIATNLKAVAKLRMVSREDKQFVQDPNYAREQNLQNEIIKIKAKEEAKRKGNLAYEDGVFQRGEGFSLDGTNIDRVVNINSKKVVDGLAGTNLVPDKSEVKLLDGTDLDDYDIVKFIPKGLVTSNVSGNEDFVGAFVGDLQVKDSNGKIKTVRAYSKNRNKDVKASFNTLSAVHKASINLPEGRGRVVDDSSGVLGSPIFKIEVVGRKNGTFVIKPVIFNPQTKETHLPSKSDLESFGLKPQMTLEELENRSLNKLEPFVEQLSKSNKNLVDESWESN